MPVVSRTMANDGGGCSFVQVATMGRGRRKGTYLEGTRDVSLIGSPFRLLWSLSSLLISLTLKSVSCSHVAIANLSVKLNFRTYFAAVDLSFYMGLSVSALIFNLQLIWLYV